MKRFSFSRQRFPGLGNGTGNLPFTEKALLRAVVAVGQGPSSGETTRAARADASMRRSAILSALDMSGSKLLPTSEFLEAGSTDKAVKSQYVGHALCAHAAYVDLNIPWLVDIENKKLGVNYKLAWLPTKKRPDFIGQDPDGRWFVFESKGRTVEPASANLSKWKIQAGAITHVNWKAVCQHIVSVAYLMKRKEWRLLWVDPPAEDEGIDLVFDEIAFFDAYYDPIINFLEPGVSSVTIEGSKLYSVPSFDAYVGIHRNILTALERRDPNLIRAFARGRANTGIEYVDGHVVSVYADGLLIALKDQLDASLARFPQDLPGETPNILHPIRVVDT